MRDKCEIIIIVLALLFGPLHGYQKSKETCKFAGTVFDENGKPLPYANIFIEGSMDGTISDETGLFQFESRLTGKHRILCSFIGYEVFEKDVELYAGALIQLKIKLKQTQIKGREVMITASSFTAADGEGVTLTAMDVVRTPGAAADLFWAIKSFPGLQQVDEGAGLFVRGGDVSETVFLLDGAIINHPYKYESPTGGFFGTFSPFLLKGTFFSSGGFSARFGNALSGALAMESHDLPDQRRMGIGIGLAAESAYLSLPIVNDKLGFSFSGNRSNTRMLFELNNTSKDFSQYPFSYDLNLNMVYKPKRNQQVKLFVYREKDKVGLEVDDPDYSTHFHGNSENELYNLRYTNLLKTKFLVQGNIALNRYSQKAQLGVLNLDIVDRFYQSNLQCETELNTGTILRAGFGLYQYLTDISGAVPIYELDVNPNAPSKKVATDYESNRAVQFVEMVTFVPGGIRLTAGLRAEYESNSKQFHADPRLSAIYSLSTNSNLTASWGLFHQYPEPKYFDPYIGNPNLGSMRSQHFIVGYAFQKENKIFRVESYYKTYDDLLLENASLNYTNNGFGHATGIDVFAKNSFGPVSGWISYSWLNARRKWNDIPVLASPYFDIPHNVSAILNIDLPKKFSVGIAYRYATGKPYTPAVGKYNQARVPSFQKLDVNLSHLHQFFQSDMVIFYVAISNVLDRINIFDYRYSADFTRSEAVESAFGRSWYFGVQFNL